MYRMFNRLPKGLEPMADIFCKHVEEEGEAVYRVARSSTQWDLSGWFRCSVAGAGVLGLYKHVEEEGEEAQTGGWFETQRAGLA